jgi:hypothetical protein
MAPRKVFDTIWRVKNTGPTWLENSTDLIFVSGARFRARAGYDFDRSISTGQRATLPEVRMRAPAARGTYTANWALHIGHQTFCSLSVKIVVR